MFPSKKKASQSLAVNSQHLSSQEGDTDEEWKKDPLYRSMHIKHEAGLSKDDSQRGNSREKPT